MRGIILAAGRGRRLEPVFPDKPKCLIQFGDKSIIQHQISALMRNGVNEVVVVVGYENQQIRGHLQNMPCTIRYIENPVFDSTNTIYSLWLAREFFDDGFIYFNADVLFDYRIIQRLCADTMFSTMACIAGLCGDEEVKVTVEGSRIIEIGKHIAENTCYGEFIGIAKFAKKDTARFAHILDECIRDRATWRYFFEYAVNFLARETVLKAVDISDLQATEIDFPEDLDNARQEIFPKLAGLEESGYQQEKF